VGSNPTPRTTPVKVPTVRDRMIPLLMLAGLGVCALLVVLDLFLTIVSGFHPWLILSGFVVLLLIAGYAALSGSRESAEVQL
jgi:hypothetical protein